MNEGYCNNWINNLISINRKKEKKYEIERENLEEEEEEKRGKGLEKLMLKWELFQRKCINFLEKNSKNIYAIRSGGKGEPAFEKYHSLFYSSRDLSFFVEKGLKYKQNISDLSG